MATKPPLGIRYSVSGSGYPEVWVDGERVYVHRLAAVAEHGFDAVAGADVHHRDGEPFNSGRENLKPVEPGRHRCMNGCGGYRGGRA